MVFRDAKFGANAMKNEMCGPLPNVSNDSKCSTHKKSVSMVYLYTIISIDVGSDKSWFNASTVATFDI